MESNETQQVKVGDRIRIIKMDDKNGTDKNGTDKNGTDKSATACNGQVSIAEHIESLGQLHLSGTSSSLAVIPRLMNLKS